MGLGLQSEGIPTALRTCVFPHDTIPGSAHTGASCTVHSRVVHPDLSDAWNSSKLQPAAIPHSTPRVRQSQLQVCSRAALAAMLGVPLQLPMQPSPTPRHPWRPAAEHTSGRFRPLPPRAEPAGCHKSIAGGNGSPVSDGGAARLRRRAGPAPPVPPSTNTIREGIPRRGGGGEGVRGAGGGGGYGHGVVVGSEQAEITLRRAPTRQPAYNHHRSTWPLGKSELPPSTPKHTAQKRGARVWGPPGGRQLVGAGSPRQAWTPRDPLGCRWAQNAEELWGKQDPSPGPLTCATQRQQEDQRCQCSSAPLTHTVQYETTLARTGRQAARGGSGAGLLPHKKCTPTNTPP